MPKTEWNRKLDLSAAAAKPAAKQKTGLTDKQAAAHQKAVRDMDRWLTKLKRAANEVDARRKTIKHYERILSRKGDCNMTFVTSTLRPGLLVNLSTSKRGNVKYERVDISTDEAHAKWETTRHVDDVEEKKRAEQAQSKARSIITSVCCQSAFGLLCRESDADLLNSAIADAQYVVDGFNESARLSRLVLRVMVGRIAQDDVTAVQRINSEVRDLMAEMQAGIEQMDVKRIRDAASAAKEVGGMLTPQAQANVQIAIETARNAARQIVKAGETAAVEVDQLAIRKIASQRTMFLDLGDQIEISRPQAEARAIDLEV